METVDEETKRRILNDPFCAFLGISVESLSAGGAEATLTISEELLNFHGTPHGGAVYSLADAAFAAASNAAGRTSVALETNISYLEAPEVGETLTATATETHAGGHTAQYEIPVESDASGRVATFRGRVYRLE